MYLAIFDLDHTLLRGDSDYLWGCFLAEQGIVDGAYYERENQRFYDQYKAGELDMDEVRRQVVGVGGGVLVPEYGDLAVCGAVKDDDHVAVHAPGDLDVAEDDVAEPLTASVFDLFSGLEELAARLEMAKAARGILLLKYLGVISLAPA